VGWAVVGCDSVMGLVVARLLLRQIRELLLDLAGVVRAWRGLVRVVEDSREPDRSSSGESHRAPRRH